MRGFRLRGSYGEPGSPVPSSREGSVTAASKDARARVRRLGLRSPRDQYSTAMSLAPNSLPRSRRLVRLRSDTNILWNSSRVSVGI